MKTHLSLDPGWAGGGTNAPGPPFSQEAHLLSEPGQTNSDFPQGPTTHHPPKCGIRGFGWGRVQRAQEQWPRDQSSWPLITDSAAENQVGKRWPQGRT